KSAAGTSSLEADHAADQIEDNQQGEHAKDCDRANPVQRPVMELAPSPAGRLFEVVRLGVGKRAPAADDAHLLEKLLLLHGARGWIDRIVRVALLRAGRQRDRDDEHEHQGTEDEPGLREQFRHASPPYPLPAIQLWDNGTSPLPLPPPLVSIFKMRSSPCRPS